MKGAVYKTFTLEDVFHISPGKRLEKRNMRPGDRPFVGASDSNNGITAFVNNTNESLDSNVLGINYNGSVCEAFYHPYECIFSDDVKRLHLKDGDDDSLVLIFAGTMIRQQKCKYEYAYKFNEQRMRRQTVMLPEGIDGRPDFGYMSSFIKQLRAALLERYKNYAIKRISELEYKDIPRLDEVEWQPFELSQFFHLIRGREANMASLERGDIPLISARNCNNGLKGFVRNPKRVLDGDVITLNNDGDGGAGLAYYQPIKMALDTHVTALVTKHAADGFAKLFMACCISGLHGFFGHGRSISNERARRTKVMFPVDAQGQPDYTYMEQYAKNMILRNYTLYLAFIQKQTLPAS